MFDDQNNRMDERFVKSDKRHDVIQEKIDDLQDQTVNLGDKIDVNNREIDGKIKIIKTTMITRAEFEELKEKVDKLEKSFASG